MAAAPHDPARAPERNRLREQLPFALVDALPQRRRVVVRLDRDHRLEDDRSTVGLASLKELDGAPGHPDTAVERPLDGVHAATKGGEQRRMHVEDGVRDRRQGTRR